MPQAYVRAVTAAGGRAVVLPPDDVDADVVGVLDGLLLAGGADVDPERYGQPPDPRTEIAARTGTRASWPCWPPRSPPTCRCSACAGGCSCSPSPTAARCTSTCRTWSVTTGTARRPGCTARTRCGSPPAAWPRRCWPGWTGSTRYHHQAVADPGDLAVTGWADDGVVEAVEDPRRRFLLGVQWHPENDPDPRPVAALVRAARR